ncbi:outer membrane lipoprotein-sorting protein [bacterium]|nr:outer membrane lipoprotein-sorting protein [bacterium]
MSLLARLVDRYAAAILLVSVLITAAMIPGIQRITIAKGFGSDKHTKYNPLVSSVLAVREAFATDLRKVAIAIEAAPGRSVTEADSLKLVGALTQKLKALAVVKKETVVSLMTIKDVVATSDGVDSQKLVQLDGTQNQAQLEHKIKNNPFLYGKLVSKDFRSTLIAASSYDFTDLSDIHNQITAIINESSQQYPGYTVELVGEPEINYQLFRGVEKDILVFVVIAFLLIPVSFFAIFRTWKGVLLPLCGIVMGIIWTMGAMGYYGEHILFISATLPVILVVIGSGYSIHMYHYLLEKNAKSSRFVDTLSNTFDAIFSPVVLGTLTAFIGAMTLLVFKIRPIQHFGIFLGVGSLLLFAVCLIVIPAMFKMVHKPGEAPPKPSKSMNLISKKIEAGLTRTLEISADWVNHRPWTIINLCIALFVASLYYTFQIKIGYDNLSLLPAGTPIRVATERIDHAYGGTQKFDVMIDAQKPSGILNPEMLANIDKFEMRARELPHVTQTFSVLQVLKTTRQLLSPDHKDILPQSSDEAAQYLFLASMSESGLPMRSLITSDNQKLNISVTVDTHDTHVAETILDDLTANAEKIIGPSAKIHVGGDLAHSIAMTRYLIWGKIQNVLAATLLIYLLIVSVLKSFTRGLITLLPLPFAAIVNFGLMGILGIRLDFATAIITSVAMGLGVDFTIHFISGVKKKYQATDDLELAISKAIEGPGRVLVQTAAATVAGFSVLLLSKFSSTQTFATLMCFSMVVLLLASVLLVPAVIRIVPPEFITNERKKKKMREPMKKLVLKTAFSFVVVLILSVAIVLVDAKAATPPATAQSLMDKAVKSIYTLSEESVYVMKLIGPDGGQSIRRMKVWYKRNGDEDGKLLIKFQEPTEIRGTGILTIMEKNKEADQWLYLPAIKKVRRIKGGNDNEPFLGSDFTIADFSVGKEGRYEYAISGTVKCGDAECHSVTGTPRAGIDKDEINYGKKVFWIRKDNNMNVKTEFYNMAGQLEKTMILAGLHKVNGAHWVADRVEMTSEIAKHKTVIEVEKRDHSKVPSDSIFTQSYLERT